MNRLFRLGALAVAVVLSKADDKVGAKEATKANILAAVGDAAKKVGQHDRLVVYMVMQGATSGEKACLFATDSTFKDRAKNALFAGDLEERFKGLKSDQVLVFIDFNLKAANTKEALLAPNIGDFVRVFLGLPEKDVDAEPPPGRVLIRNGTGIQPHLDDGKNGLFTAVVADALRGKADTDGYEPDGVIMLDELTKYVDKQVSERGAHIGKTADERLQAARVNGFATPYPVARNPEAAAKTEERLTKYEKKVGETKLDKDAKEEGEKLLARMPKLKALQELRKSYQKFADGDLTADQLAAARERIKTGMNLSDADATTSADKVYSALTPVRANYIKKLNLGEMVAAGVKGLYKGTDTKLSDELNEKLAKAKDLSDADLKKLIKEARTPIGKREDLDEDKDVGS